jgi:uncharacterized phage protein (TIGR02220 family)
VIVEYLNRQTGKSFKHNTQATRRLILARWREGWTTHDFHDVILYKSKQWATDPKMMAFLRPETLFSNKFESYLQEARVNGKALPTGTISTHCSKTVSNLSDWSPPDEKC